MEYRYLKAFLLTARHLSFSKAAHELQIAQSAVSRQIKMLEEKLGSQLLIRSPNQIILTALGQEVFLALTDFDRNIELIFKRDVKPEIRVGILHGVLETWGIAFLAEAIDELPSNLVIEVERPDTILAKLARRELDLSITNENLQTETITSLKLFDEKLVVISRDPINLARVHEHRWITYAEEDWLPNIFKRKPSPDRIRVNSMTAIINLVRAGVGIAIVPTHILGDETTLHRQAVPIEQQPAMYLSMLNYTYLPPHLKPWVDRLKKAARNAS